jgi:hypothetical protein
MNTAAYIPRYSTRSKLPLEEFSVLQIKGTAVLDTVEAVKARAGEHEFDRFVALLDDEAKQIFQQGISPSSWYPFDAFVRFLEMDVRETADGKPEALIQRSEAVVEKQLRGVYKIFVRLGSPEFVIKRIAAVHSTYFNGIQIIPVMTGKNRAVIQYYGFSKEHSIIGFAIIGFFRQALEISGAKGVHTEFTLPIERGERYCELVITWS